MVSIRFYVILKKGLETKVDIRMENFSAKSFLLALFALFIIAFSSLIYVLVKVNPETARLGSFLVFYLALFFTILSGISIAGYVLRTALSRNSPLYRYALISFRQGALIAVLVVVLLVLQSLRAVSLLSVALLVFSLALFEVAMLTRS